ncbi:MAG: hypothetical protein AAGA45_00385, partial [Verrucomicrobiota bacterium]
DARPEIYFDPEETYIWDLLFAEDGSLYVATGTSGTIYKLPPDFKPGDEATVWFESDRDHITTMTFDLEGNILAGTAPEAYLYRISPDGLGTVLYNAGTDEISAIAPGKDDTVYFSTLHRASKGNSNNGDATALDLPAVLERLYRQQDHSNNGQDNDDDEPSASVTPSMLFRVDSNGFAEPLWSPVSMNIYTFLAQQDGGFLVGGSEDGKLFNVVDLTEWSLLQTAAEGGEISVLLPLTGEDVGGVTYVMTSNPATIYKLSSTPADKGTFTAKPIDAQITAKWGALRLFGSLVEDLPGLSWETRSGNSPEPDATWSEWSALQEQQVASPNGRYLQYRVTFENAETALQGVRLFFALQNAAPIVSRINVLPVGLTVVTLPPKTSPIKVSQLISGPNGSSISKPTPPVRQIRPRGEPGFFSAGWKSFDPNGDLMEYAIAIKAEDGTEWVTLGEDIEVNVFSFNTRGLEDGYYQLRVTASDSPSNPPGQERSGLKISQPFLIDNTNPTVELETQKNNDDSYVLVFTAKDAHSIISEASYVLDGGKPVQLQPEDSIFDSPEEIFRVVLDNPTPGEHSIVLEVKDERGNRGVAQTVFSIE